MSMIGKTLGNFECTALIGKGGMGEVYRAKDQKLGRDVAIKVLPEEFARDADRVARFQREAKLLASLNHPHIAAIYGLEESDGTQFLVLELIDGETLSDRLKHGPIPVEESLKLALQIAESLEAAHDKGVIHRDLKPANIKVTPDGKVKILDFGLAKAFTGEQEVNLSNSPTLSEAATMQGVILGTAAYMSPEQARGKPVDKRTDIWAFGCVLYEMLTGKAAFQGEDVTEILAAVVKSGVNLDLLPANVHPRVREVLIRCLQKDQKKRYADISEAQYEIGQVLTDPSGVFVQAVAAAKPRKQLRLSLPWIVVCVLLAAIVTGLAVWTLKPVQPRQVMRFYHDLATDQRFSALNLGILAVSPDGNRFIYATPGGLYLRSADEFDAKLIAGTETSPENPFFSPDGKWVGYWSSAESKLKKISINGGAPVALCDASIVLGASWGVDDIIVYGEVGKGIMRVSANGGTPQPLVKLTGLYLVNPQILPDGKNLLYADVRVEGSQIVLQSLESGERKVLIEGDSAVYVSTGHLVYMVKNTLFAVPFDLGKLEVKGGPVSLVEAVYRTGPNNAPQRALSDSGTLAYIPGTGTEVMSAQRTLVWVDRNGKEEPLSASPNAYIFPRISPDGTQVALSVGTFANSDVWIWDVVRKNLTRLTFDASGIAPLWTPDGKRIVFSSENGRAVKWKAADGTGKVESLGGSPGQFVAPWSWADKGKTLILETLFTSGGVADIGVLPLEGDRKWKPLLQEKYLESNPQVSPDGRWMAYSSNESGRAEIYVRPFPDVDGGRWQVSTSGGTNPLWSRECRDLFYRNGDAVMVVSVKTDPSFSRDTPKALFRGTYASPSPVIGTPWDISPDSKRFLMIKEPAADNSTAGAPHRINIVVNWLEELKERVPVK